MEDIVHAPTVRKGEPIGAAPDLLGDGEGPDESGVQLSRSNSL